MIKPTHIIAVVRYRSNDMGYEIERKFKANLDEAITGIGDGTAIIQGYLTTKPPVIRIRVSAKNSGDDKTSHLTIKGPGLVVRSEYEFRIPNFIAVWLLGHCRATIRKIRYKKEFAGKVWEIDRFTGRHGGLCIAEVELSQQNEYVELPPWVNEEVTRDPHYTNLSMAVSGFVPGTKR